MIYLDSSALVKRVREEPESAALARWLAGQDAEIAISSALVRVEVVRAVTAGGPDSIARARTIFGALNLVQLTPALLDVAAGLKPPLRGLDAIHLASAMRVGRQLTAFVAYDKRLLAAAEDAGLPTAAPGAS